MMFIASLSYSLTNTRAIITDYIFRFMTDFVNNFLQDVFYSNTIPTLCYGNVYNCDVFFSYSRACIVCRCSKCK